MFSYINIYKSKFFLVVFFFSLSQSLCALPDIESLAYSGRGGYGMDRELAKLMAKIKKAEYFKERLATIDADNAQIKKYADEYAVFKKKSENNKQTYLQFKQSELDELMAQELDLKNQRDLLAKQIENIEKTHAAVAGGHGQPAIKATNPNADKSYIKLIQEHANVTKKMDQKLAEKTKMVANISELGKISESDLATYRFDENEKAMIRKQYANVWRPTDAKALLAQGLAAESWEQIDTSTIDTWSDAIKQGLIANAAKKLGDVLGRRMENALELTVGSWFDMGFKKFMDAFSGIGNMLFYGGKDPFTPQEIESWKKLIKEVLDDIEKMLKDGLKDSLRGHDFTARPVLEDGQADGIDVNEAKADAEKDFIWTALMEGYAEQFGKMIEVFESRKKHYRKTSMVIFYVDQLNKRLNKLKDTLSASNSLKDFDTALHSSKAILTAYKKNIISLFDRLSDDDDVKPQTYSLATKGGTATKTTRPSRRDDFDDRDGGFPNNYGGMAGGY